MGDDSEFDDLIRRASDPAVTTQSLQEAVSAVFSSLSPNDRQGAEELLERLADEIIDAPTRPDAAGIVALCCGALVERGLGPTIALGPILDRLESAIAPDAIAFVAACRQSAEEEAARTAPSDDERPEDDGKAEQEPKTDPVERHGERLASLLPVQAQSFHALEPFSLAAIAMLSRSVESRKASWSRTALRASLDELGGQYGYAGMLWMMMQVLDDEELVVLCPDQGKGYRVRITGLGDNFQLHTLLADALIGRFSSRWLRGRRPAKADVEVARSGPLREDAPPARGSFNLWNWQGLQADGTLRDVKAAGSAYWIWNEGVPADIARFEGTRVVLLGPPPYDRSWNSVRRFPGMTGDLCVEQVLTRDEVRGFLDRLAAQAPMA